MLSKTQIDLFIDQGYIGLEEAFSTEVARQCRELLWKATGCDPNERATWTKPVVRIGEMTEPPFREAANAPRLHEAFDQLVGAGNWIARQSLGSFPIRFPLPEPGNDTGWHVDASFPGNDPGDYLQWRINVMSRGRGLLMLFLFSDVGDNDAPTRITVGSHTDVARALAPHGQAGLSFMQLAELIPNFPVRREALATGAAGTVYLCHPFIVHAAQDHRGTSPKFMAQPPLPTRKDLNIDAPTAKHPVELAIQMAIGQSAARKH